jgi:hypothetical protein
MMPVRLHESVRSLTQMLAAPTPYREQSDRTEDDQKKQTDPDPFHVPILTLRANRQVRIDA